jgi:carboxyl-terminal processing protease
VAFLTAAQRQSVLDRVIRLIDTKFMGIEPNTAKLRDEHGPAIVNADDPEVFELAINTLLQALGTSHTGLFHESRPRSTGRIAMAATLTKAETPDGQRWMFQDVHPGGVAAAAGIVPGDILLTIDGQELVPPTAIPFRLGQSYVLTVRKANGSTATPTLAIPGSHEKNRPIVVPDQVVTARKLAPDIGYVRVSMFPGILGMDVARDTSRAIAELNAPRLVIDLRGNTGGGIGCLRLMSYMCPDRRGVGYSVTRAVAQKGFTKERLPAFDRIPSSKLGVIPLMFRFATAGRSVAVFTESLGEQQHHGRIALLVNEHSASAAEMVAAFASEYRLATLVGTKTAGRLVATSAFRVGFGYRVVLPVAAYYTWHGSNLEGKGVSPDIAVLASTAALRDGRDDQLARAAGSIAAG